MHFAVPDDLTQLVRGASRGPPRSRSNKRDHGATADPLKPPPPSPWRQLLSNRALGPAQRGVGGSERQRGEHYVSLLIRLQGGSAPRPTPPHHHHPPHLHHLHQRAHIAAAEGGCCELKTFPIRASRLLIQNGSPSVLGAAARRLHEESCCPLATRVKGFHV